jgi:hypothetical protein
VNQLGSSQCHSEEGRVPPGVHLVLMQQEEYHLGGQQQVDHHVLQEGTQGSSPDPKACHKNPQDIRSNVHHHKQVCPGRGEDP